MYLRSAMFGGALLLASHTVSAADWASEWHKTLGELWMQTKAKTQEVLDPAKFRPQKTVEIGVAYGTEKQKWLEWAVPEFAKTEVGKLIKINLIPMGSVEGAAAVLKQDQRIHVWSPASSMVEELLRDPWQREHKADPILSDAPLAISPMVIAMWEDRYKAFITKYNDVNFKTLAQALEEKTGWAAIANKPEWGVFSFAQTNPAKSNSGLMSLVLMGHDYWDVNRGLKSEQVMDAGFITWLGQIAQNVDAEENSTGKMMDEMLRFGPTKYNAVMVYENLALSNLATAKGRWGNLSIIYPTRTVWNDNPYYILNVSWSTPEQRDAAKLFQAFLLSDPAQKVARDKFLFRPANVNLPIVGEGSSFNALKEVVKMDVPAIRRPSAEVMNQLLQLWDRAYK